MSIYFAEIDNLRCREPPHLDLIERLFDPYSHMEVKPFKSNISFLKVFIFRSINVSIILGWHRSIKQGWHYSIRYIFKHWRTHPQSYPRLKGPNQDGFCRKWLNWLVEPI
jgi:hypothetical protein